MIKTSLTVKELDTYLKRLVSHFVPDGYETKHDTQYLLERSLDRIEHCFSRIERKYYQDSHGVVFDHLNGDHMASLLWFYSNTIWKETGDEEMPTRLFYINKALHGIDLFYSVQMPDVFLLVHPVGTVIGKATFSDYLVVYQNCTIGATIDIYPHFGEGVVLYSRTTVIGKSSVGKNVVFAAGASIIDTDVPDGTVVAGSYPKHRFLHNRETVVDRCFSSVSIG